MKIKLNRRDIKGAALAMDNILNCWYADGPTQKDIDRLMFWEKRLKDRLAKNG